MPPEVCREVPWPTREAPGSTLLKSPFLAIKFFKPLGTYGSVSGAYDFTCLLYGSKAFSTLRSSGFFELNCQPPDSTLVFLVMRLG